jgi:IS1 family transposase
MIFESATPWVISYGAGHASEIQIVKNQYVRNAEVACCILSHVPSCWPKMTLKKLVDRLTRWDVKVYCTDKWGTYASVIPQDKLMQSKATTQTIERNHCRQHHRFGRFKRKSIIISKSTEMVDLTMALFAKFWVNGTQDELLSLLS